MKKIALTRYSKNPILTPTSNWWEKKQVFNSAAIVKDGKIHLLYRAIGSVPVSSLGYARLTNPTTVEYRSSEPVLIGGTENKFERFGIEDPRIVILDEQIYVVYVATSLVSGKDPKPAMWSHSGTPWRIRTELAITNDFIHFKKKGLILGDLGTKDATLFPEKIGDEYFLLHRIFPDIWISHSKNITDFPKGKKFIVPRPNMWDSDRIGAGAPPIKTEYGWLLFYHGVSQKQPGDFTYMLGMLLLDLIDPHKILYRSAEPILIPTKEYERGGNTKNVVFTCGAIEWEDRFYIFYGAGDSVLCTAWIEKQELLQYLKSKIES